MSHQVGYVMNTMFPTNQTFVKLSLLALYYRFFSVNKSFVRWVWVIGTLHFCWFMAMFWIRWFMCTPVARVWNPRIPGHCIDSNMLLAVGEAFNSVFDFVMVALAVWVVLSLKVTRATRWKLSILFALGGLSGVIGFVKIGQAYGGVGANILNAVWDEVQMAASIVCCCAPIYRSIVIDFPLLRSIWSKTLGGSSKRTSEKGSGGAAHHPRAIRTFGQGSRTRGHRRDPDASLMNESQKGWAQDDWYSVGSGSGDVRAGSGSLPQPQPVVDATPAYPAPVQGVHVYRTVEVV